MIEIGLDGVRYTFRTLEGAYQAFKCPERMHEFTDLGEREAVALGRTVTLRSDWDAIKDTVRNYLLHIKYEKGEDRSLLLRTPKEKLKEPLLTIREECKRGYTIDHNANFLCEEYCKMRDAARKEQKAGAVYPLSFDKTFHCANVARFCMENAEKYGLSPDIMYTVGLLHDIGYLYGRGCHEVHGAELLEKLGMNEEYTYAISLHGHDPKDIVLQNLTDTNIRCLCALYEADMSVDAKGHVVGFDRRLADIQLRYGKNHVASMTAANEIDFVKWYQKEHHIAPAKINQEKALSLFGISDGVICQQCNCVGAYGAGISGAISRQFPEVENDFREQFAKHQGKQFNTHRILPLSDTLSVANIYSQNSIKTSDRDIPTDMESLIEHILAVQKETNRTVYLPHSRNLEHDGIGCGLGGGKWSELVTGLQKRMGQESLPIYALNTMTGVVGEKISEIDVTKIEDYRKENEPVVSEKGNQKKDSLAFKFGGHTALEQE